MATTITNLISSKVISNLDTYNYTVRSQALHVAKLQINEIPPSGITITIKQNGTTIASSSAPQSPVSRIDLSATMQCNVSDVISIVVASSTSSDELPNAFKGILNIHVGSLN